MKRYIEIFLLICFLFVYYGCEKQKGIIVPAHLYSKEIPKHKVDYLYIKGWKECMDSIKLNKLHVKFYGLPQEWFPIYTEILEKEFRIKVIGVAGCVVNKEDDILWSGFNDCIENYAKDKYHKDVFEYSSQLAKESIPELPILNMDSVISKIVYPKYAIKKKIKGTVIVSGMVEKDGTLDKLEIVKSLGYGCDEEVLRIAKMFRCKPAKITKYARALGRIAIPIQFSIEK